MQRVFGRIFKEILSMFGMMFSFVDLPGKHTDSWRRIQSPLCKKIAPLCPAAA